MKVYISRLANLVFGLFLFSLGIVMTIKANIGYAPWDVFHAGIVELTGISFGNVSIIVGLIIVLLAWGLGEKIGIGTLLNMYLIGVFLDLLLAIDIPKSPHFGIGIIVLFFGLWTIAFGSFFYIRAGFGTGPRDSLMIALNKKTGLAIGISRAIIEFSAAIIGWFMGGLLGIGTLISAILISSLVQWTFRFLKFNPAHLKHENLMDTFNNIKVALKKTHL